MEENLIEKFERNVVKTDDCWLWDGPIDNHGYGKFFHKGRTHKAHRFSFELYKGAIPVINSHHGNCVLHKCDVTNCVNPHHLFLGTQSENMRDKTLKGRAIGANKGADHHKAKLNDELVFNIKNDLRTHIAIAQQYGVGRSTITDIKKGKTWTHIK